MFAFAFPRVERCNTAIIEAQWELALRPFENHEVVAEARAKCLGQKMRTVKLRYLSRSHFRELTVPKL